MEPFGNLMTDQPIQLNPGFIGGRTFLQMKVGMKCDLVAWILGLLRVDAHWCLLVKPDDSWAFRWIWNLGWFRVQKGTEEFVSEMPCFLHRYSVVSYKRLPLNAAKPVGLENLLELVFNDCPVDSCGVLVSPGIQKQLLDLVVP